MTVIAGLITGNTVWMAGDRAAVNSEDRRWHLKRPKIFRNGPFLLGHAGSVRTGNILEHVLDGEALRSQVPDADDLEWFLVNEFVDTVRKTLKDRGIARREDEVESVEATMLVGIQGRLFEIYSDYQVLEVTEPYTAIGSGAAYVLGALFCSGLLCYQPPQGRLAQAVEAAAHYCTGVCLPVDILSLEN